MEVKQAITFEQVKELMDTSYSLYYVDYRDSFDESLSELQKSVQAGNWEAIDELIVNWDVWESVKYIEDELKKELADKFELEDEEVDDLFDEFEDEIRDEIYNRDDSTPIKDLLRNTGDIACFYDLQEDISDTDWCSVKDSLKQIKKRLKIPLKNKTFDKDLSMMISQAGYGGNLVIYFNVDDWEDIITTDANEISFSDFTIAIIHNGNGSGDHCEISHSFKIPFIRSNFYIDNEVKYSYVHEVCGMSDNFCSNTCYTLSLNKRLKKREEEKSKLQYQMEREAQYEKTYKEGKCTFGDMKYTRHRDTFYLNEYPCGNHCPHCNTFWID